MKNTHYARTLHMYTSNFNINRLPKIHEEFHSIPLHLSSISFTIHKTFWYSSRIESLDLSFCYLLQEIFLSNNFFYPVICLNNFLWLQKFKHISIICFNNPTREKRYFSGSFTLESFEINHNLASKQAYQNFRPHQHRTTLRRQIFQRHLILDIARDTEKDEW